MEQKEFDALVEKIEKSTGAAIDEKLKAALAEVPGVVLEKINNESEELKKANEELKEIVEKQGLEITDMKEKGANKVHKSFRSAVKEALEENKEALARIKNGGSKDNVRMSLKVAGPMALSTNIVSNAQIPQADREDGITRIVRRNPFLLEIINVGSITSNLWEWVEQVNADGGAAMTAEGAAKSQADFDLALASAKVEKVTAYIKVSKEMLDDVPLMESEINQELTELINLKIDAEILSGDGTSNSLVGILENATAWSVTGFANTVAAANNFDALRVAINQVNVAQFNPTHIVLHPTDAAQMDLEKGTDGHYVMPPFSTANGSNVKGIPVITNTGMTVGDFLVGDFTKSGVRFREGLTIDVGYENDDFTKNFVTILAEARLSHRVKSNHYGAFVTGTFATAKALLDPDVADS